MGKTSMLQDFSRAPQNLKGSCLSSSLLWRNGGAKNLGEHYCEEAERAEKNPLFSNLINAGKQKLISHGLNPKLGKLIKYIHCFFITCTFTSAAILFCFLLSFLQVFWSFSRGIVYICVNKITVYVFSIFLSLCLISYHWGINWWKSSNRKNTELLLHHHVLEQLEGMVCFLHVCNKVGYRFLYSDLEDLKTR